MASDDEIRAFNAMAARIESIEKAMNDHIVGIEAKMQALIQVFGLSVDQTLDWINLSLEFVSELPLPTTRLFSILFPQQLNARQIYLYPRDSGKSSK
jgi:hypothetical protein